jgi:CBS domain-containing protein
MTICPFCGFENIEGADVCGGCSHSLIDVETYTAATEVERSLLLDPLNVLTARVPIVVAPDTPVRDVLVEREVGCVIVAEQGAIRGIFSERDALMKLNDQAEALGDEPIRRFMTADPQSLSPTDKVAFAVQRMDLGSYRHVPIVDENGQVNGIISVRDILRYLTAKMHESGAVD